MATSTKRADVVKKLKAEKTAVAKAGLTTHSKGKGKGKGKPAAKKSATLVAAEKRALALTIQRDKRVTGLMEKYEHNLATPEAMVTLMTGLVGIWSARSNTYEANDTACETLFEMEQAARKAASGKVALRDQRVGKYEFRSVLRLAKKDNGPTAWANIVKHATNWTMCKTIASKVGTFINQNKKAPTEKWIAAAINERHTQQLGESAPGKKKKRGGSLDTNATADQLVARMLNASKKFAKKYAAKIDIEKEVKRVIELIGAIATAVKNAPKEALTTAKASTRGATVVTADQTAEIRRLRAALKKANAK